MSRRVSVPDSAGTVRRRQRTLSGRMSVLIGIVLGVLVAGAGLAYAAAHTPTWSVQRDVVVVPASSTDVSDAAALYDSLSRGQVGATVAEIYGEPRWHTDTPGVTVVAGVVPPSAVVQITASGPNRAAVSRALDEVIASGTRDVNATVAPYRAVVLTKEAPAPTTTGPGRGVLSAVAILAALLAGVLATGLARRATRRA